MVEGDEMIWHLLMGVAVDEPFLVSRRCDVRPWEMSRGDGWRDTYMATHLPAFDALIDHYRLVDMRTSRELSALVLPLPFFPPWLGVYFQWSHGETYPMKSCVGECIGMMCMVSGVSLQCFSSLARLMGRPGRDPYSYRGSRIT